MSEDIQTLTSTLATLSQVSQAQPSQAGVQVQPVQAQDATVAATVPPPPAVPPAPAQNPAPAPAPIATANPEAVANPESPTRRRPGRPKGSGKRTFEVIMEPRVKRPVGRPRKDGLPAGSVGPKRPPGRPKKRPPGTFASGSTGATPQVLTYTAPYGEQWGTSISAPPMASLQHRPAPTAPAPVSTSQSSAIDPTLDSNDWQSMRQRQDFLLYYLTTALHAPNPTPTSGVRLDEAFLAHLHSLQSSSKLGSTLPQLYSTLKTFWLPWSPAYFSLTASAATAPSEYRFFYWDPYTLVFNGIACPVCGDALKNNGRINSGPIKVYDLGKPFFIIGCEYLCTSATCKPNSPRAEGRRFASTDPSIIRSLPVKLRDDFPAKLMHGPAQAPDLGSGPHIWSWCGMGVSTALWNMVRASLNAGMRKDAILGIIKGVTDGVPEDPIPPWYAVPPPVQPQTFAPPPVPQQHAPQPVAGPSGQNQDVDMNGNQEDAEGSQEEEEEEEEEEEARDKPVEQTTYEAWTVNATKANGAAPVAGPSEPNGQQQQQPNETNNAAPQTIQQPQPQQIQQHPQLEYPPMPPPTPSPQFSTGHQAPFISFAPTPAYAFAYPPAPPPATPLKRPYSAIEDLSASGSSQRRIRHCVKCGSHECKGKGGRAFCKNPCQDCGKLECPGRNSKRPDRSCKDAWEGE
ncbi:hypothetical protein QCA50_006098 [Cerrena zonata]|uniref:Uncharacterized protein n=1 Tax=Cerrena zonata TaxID=2478898 RepID=A0AAW0GIF9_9APHY